MSLPAPASQLETDASPEARELYQVREWQDTRKRTIRAAFVSLDGEAGTIRLQQAAGQAPRAVKLDALSADDLTFLFLGIEALDDARAAAAADPPRREARREAAPEPPSPPKEADRPPAEGEAAGGQEESEAGEAAEAQPPGDQPDESVEELPPPTPMEMAVGLAMLILHFGVAVWVVRDAKRRGASPWLWGLLALGASVFGAALYAIWRSLPPPAQTATEFSVFVNCRHKRRVPNPGAYPGGVPVGQFTLTIPAQGNAGVWDSECPICESKMEIYIWGPGAWPPKRKRTVIIGLVLIPVGIGLFSFIPIGVIPGLAALIVAGKCLWGSLRRWSVFLDEGWIASYRSHDVKLLR